MSISAQAESLYESEQDKDLLLFAEDNWPDDSSGITAAHAELARFARIAAYRTESPTIEVWQARHVASAAISGNLRSLALSLQPLMFSLVADGLPEQARQILDLMAALVNKSTIDSPPRRDLVDRIICERRAHTYAAERRWDDACGWYERAAALAPTGSRGAAKVAGGAAVTRWLAGGAETLAVDAFAGLAEVEWPDVREWARTNLAAARLGDRTGAVPFDLI